MTRKNNDQKDHLQKPRLNSTKWILVLVIILGGLIANSYYAQVEWALRAAAGIIIALVVLAIAFQTEQGAKVWAFLKASRAELHKVVWPTRQETIQTSVVVIAMVLVTAIVLWGLDSLLITIVSWLAA